MWMQWGGGGGVLPAAGRSHGDTITSSRAPLSHLEKKAARSDDESRLVHGERELGARGGFDVSRDTANIRTSSHFHTRVRTCDSDITRVGRV